MPNIIDPVTEPSVLREPSFCMDELDFDALSSPLLQLQGKVDKKPQTAAIILAGGTGERFGKEGGKQLVEIAGKPILTWSAEAFDAVGDVGLIVIVCPEERMHEYLSRAIDPFPFVTPVCSRLQGPFARSRRSRGSRWWATSTSTCAARRCPAARVARPHRAHHQHGQGQLRCRRRHCGASGGGYAEGRGRRRGGGHPDRSVFWNAQTPQVFRAGIYRRAHASALSDGFVGTDDSSLIERLGGKVLIVEGKRDNIKLTVPEDYVLLASAVRTMLLNSEHR